MLYCTDAFEQLRLPHDPYPPRQGMARNGGTEPKSGTLDSPLAADRWLGCRRARAVSSAPKRWAVRTNSLLWLADSLRAGLTRDENNRATYTPSSLPGGGTWGSQLT